MKTWYQTPSHPITSRDCAAVPRTVGARGRLRIAAICALLLLPGLADTVSAQDRPADPSLSVFPLTASRWVADTPAEGPVRRSPFGRESRGKAISSLYVSLGVLQAMDVYTTMSALNKGAREANPMMAGVAGSPGGLVAAKVAATAGTILLAERVWKKNRVAAIGLLAALNSVTAIVVANNMNVARQLSR